MTLRFDGEQVHLIHPPVPRAHTDADTITVFERDNVVSTGDLFDNGIWPYMRRSSVDGYIAAQELILSFTNDETLIVPGHGALARRADLLKSVQRMREVHRRIAALIGAGLSREEVVARHPIDDLDPFTGPPAVRRKNNTSETIAGSIYDSLKENAARDVKTP